MEMDLYSIVSTVTTLFFGGGWFVHYREGKRKAKGEAIQAEAGGWEQQQKVYQTTIEDQQRFYEHLKADFNVVVEENANLRKENNELRKKVNNLEDVVYDLKKEVSRLGRKIAAMSKDEKEMQKQIKNNKDDGTEA